MSDQKTILLVDDTPENIELLSGILDGHYTLKVALNGQRALKVVAKSQPDLILLDVVMPGMDGYEVCTTLKTDPATSEIPIIFVTGTAPDTEKEQALGAVGTVTKPIDPATLRALIADNL
ncbi:MAG: response regulator [Magnetococcales bacterium]|nr:response regulator [Magnetococcales bacterium]